MTPKHNNNVALDAISLVSGGMHRLASAVAALEAAQGVAVWRACAGVETQHGAAVGVTLADGERIAADAVVGEQRRAQRRWAAQHHPDCGHRQRIFAPVPHGPRRRPRWRPLRVLLLERRPVWPWWKTLGDDRPGPGKHGADANTLRIGRSGLTWDGTTLTAEIDEVTAPQHVTAVHDVCRWTGSLCLGCNGCFRLRRLKFFGE